MNTRKFDAEQDCALGERGYCVAGKEAVNVAINAFDTSDTSAVRAADSAIANFCASTCAVVEADAIALNEFRTEVSTYAEAELEVNS